MALGILLHKFGNLFGSYSKFTKSIPTTHDRFSKNNYKGTLFY